MSQPAFYDVHGRGPYGTDLVAINMTRNEALTALGRWTVPDGFSLFLRYVGTAPEAIIESDPE